MLAANLAGHPPLSVPYGTAADGPPLGVPGMAPATGEETIVRVAAALGRSLA